jgi:hypothetical protein
MATLPPTRSSPCISHSICIESAISPEMRQFVESMTCCRAGLALERSARGVTDGVSSLVGWHLHCDLRVARIPDGLERATTVAVDERRLCRRITFP